MRTLQKMMSREIDRTIYISGETCYNPFEGSEDYYDFHRNWEEHS